MKSKEKLVQFFTKPANFKLQYFANKYPHIYLISVILLAILGFGYLITFPFLIVFALIQLFAVSANPLHMESLSQTLFWFAVMVFAIGITHHIFTMRFKPYKGLSLPQNKAPQLFDVIRNTKCRLFWPNIHRVVISDKFELNIYKTPIFGLPIWSKNTLVVGLPLIQSLSQSQFECALTRKLIQFSYGKNIITNWLYQLRYVWSLYPTAFASRNLLGEQFISWFFKPYANIYRHYSRFAAQKEELLADKLALVDINDRDLFKTIEAQVVIQYFYNNYYLPTFINLASQKRNANLAPFSKLPSTLIKTLSNDRVQLWLDKLRLENRYSSSMEPSLIMRMENIGYNKLKIPKIQPNSAARYYFGENYPAIITMMNKAWSLQMDRRLKNTSIVEPAPTKLPMRILPTGR